MGGHFRGKRSANKEVKLNKEDTIAAIATPFGAGSIGVIRLSGEKAIEIVEKIFVSPKHTPLGDFPSHRVIYGHIVDKDKAEIIDEVICLVMRAPRSYTREDVVEIQCHGGMMPLRRILALVLAQGARLAEAGEFTKRAFLNGRLDLAQAQAVMDIIEAKSESSLRMASGHLMGKFSQQINSIREPLLEMIAHYEATIDFPEEEVDPVDNLAVSETLYDLQADIDEMLRTAHTGRILKDGLMTAIIGKPNVGKSSLLNFFLQEERAIVTDIPGTTRDSLEEYANIEGIPFRFIDTAGIRETEDKVEKIGVEKAHTYLEQADIILVVLDSSRPLDENDERIFAMLKEKDCYVLVNKSDLPAQWDIDVLPEGINRKRVFLISTRRGSGLENVIEAIKEDVYSGNAQREEAIFVNNVRQVEALKKAKQHLDDALRALDDEVPEDLVVIDLRSAWETLGDILGDSVNEEVIDEIFSRFCIGK